jgi:tetratricopeptide (TPR) repeat protein
VGIAFGVALTSWNWLEARLTLLVTPDRSDADLEAVSDAFNNGDLDSAIAAARSIWAAQPDNVEVLIWLARSLIYRSYSDYDRGIDREVALQITTDAYSRMPDSADVLAIHAFALQANGQAVRAARVAEEALALEPGHGLAQIARGLAYGSAGAFDVSLRETQTAASGGVWQVDAQRALAISYSDLGQYREAIEAVDGAIALNERLLALHFERALYALQLGDTDRATAAYFRVLAYDPTNVKARLRLCEVSSMLREQDSALRYCQEVTQLAPTWSDGWHRLGREYFLQGNFRAARESLGRCSSLQVMMGAPIAERQFECWYLQGQAAEILGDCDTLLATYNEFRAMAAEADLPQTWTYPPEGPAICLPDP